MNNLKTLIAEQLINRRISRDVAKELFTAMAAPHQQEDIAIIGMAGRFSAAHNVEEFWGYLTSGIICIRDFPVSRQIDMREIFHNPSYAELILGAPIAEADFGSMYAKSGYLERIDTFDAAFFGIPPLEADYMDPNQRIALEVAYEACENAGYGGDAIRGTRTGVFLGRDHSNFSFYRMTSERNPMQLSGSWEGLAAGRVSYLFDLKGPCLVTDTACSAGAVSIHLAIHSLLIGECDMALAGGINLSSIGEPKSSLMSGATMNSVESGDDTIRTFDARANGTLWGEGAGMLLLKPLRRALADRDHVRAVIKATAVNNDGTSNSITAPNALQQEQVILDAWLRSGVEAETISYVEAHGTGTVLGDPIEIKGLTNAFRRHTDKRQFCGIGSLKTSMGHMVAASGVASVAKVVKSLETRMLAPSANFEVPNPYVDFTESPLYVNDRLTAWESSGPRRAAINSFGFIRTNCHLVLEEAPTVGSAPQVADSYCFTVSARTATAQAQLLDRYAAALSDKVDSFADVCFTSNIGRGHYEYRTSVIARSMHDLVESLDWARANPGASNTARGVRQGMHTIVSDRKRDCEPTDLTGTQRRQLSQDAAAAADRYRSSRHRQDLQDIADLYVRGAEVNFAALYDGDPRSRVILPAYAFEQTRHWARPMRTAVEMVRPPQSQALVGEPIVTSGRRIEFTRTFTENDWVLADHLISGRPVLPGTVYLEMVRGAFAQVTGSDRMRLSNVMFLQPLILTDDTVTMRTSLEPDDDGFRFVVASLDGEMGMIAHAEGRVSPLPQQKAPVTLNLAAVRASATEVSDPFMGDKEAGVFTFGPHWDVVRAAWNCDEGVLARLQLPTELQGEAALYRLHPSLLDNAVNLISQVGAHTYLPYVYKSLELYGPMPEMFFSFIRVVRDEGPDAEIITYDVDLYDEEGRLFVRIIGYAIKRVDWARFDIGQHLRFGWELVDNRELRGSEILNGCWAAVITDTNTGSALGDELAAAGFTVARLGDLTDAERGVFAGDEAGISALVETWRAECVDGVLWLTPAAPNEDSAAAHQTELTALFWLSNILVRERIRLGNGLRIAVTGSATVEGDDLADPYSYAAATLMTVCAQEYPHLNICIVDLPSGFTSTDLLQVAQVSGPVRQAWRGTRTFVPRLAPATMSDADPGPLYAGGFFLISGGLGGLGLSLAEEMVCQGASLVVLTGRRALGESDRERISSMTGVVYRQCDMADQEQVQDLVEWLEAEGLSLTGIVHAAGVAGAGYLATKSLEEFESVLRPKVSGGLAALEIVRRHPGAFLALFSSITGIVGGHGQGDYAAANAFLDGLALRAQSEGINAVSINWPSWAEVGMAIQHGVEEGDTLVRPIDIALGLRWFTKLVAGPVPGVVPGELNMSVAREHADDLGTLLEGVLGDIGAAERAMDGNEAPVRLRGISQPRKVQQQVGDAFGYVLGLAELDPYASFQDMGGNSLMTAQLLKRIDRSFPGVVDIADLFSYSSVVDLANYIEQQMQTSTHEANESGDLLSDLLDELDDDELRAIFANDTASDHGDRT